MSAGDVFLLIVRWTHLVAAAAWIGGSLFYLLVLRPASRRAPDSTLSIDIATAAEFRGLVDTSILVLIATGVVLTVDRLTGGVAGTPYVVTLGIKIGLALWMFMLARTRQRRGVAGDSSGRQPTQAPTRLQRFARLGTRYNLIVIVGIVVFLMSDLLKVLFEIDLGRRP